MDIRSEDIEILKIVKIEDLERASLRDVILAMGRLLSIKASPTSSVHEVTKEVRRALELVMRSPLRSNVENAIAIAVNTTPPFESKILNAAYKRLLEKLLREVVKETSDMSPMWKRRVLNLVVEDIYNVAVAQDTKQIREDIFTKLKEIKKEETR